MAKEKVYKTFCPFCSHKKSRSDITKSRIGSPLDRCDACGAWYLGYDKREWENLNAFRQSLYLAIHRRRKAREAIDASLERMKNPEYRKAVAREFPVHTYSGQRKRRQ
jgi:hypothetical protein